MYSDYSTLISAYLDITADFSADERTALLSANAERVYRI
jgi:predicted TIM-barrel fold metal-dependent hydrolase